MVSFLIYFFLWFTRGMIEITILSVLKSGQCYICYPPVKVSSICIIKLHHEENNVETFFLSVSCLILLINKAQSNNSNK